MKLCLDKNAAKVLGGKPDAAAACQAKFSDALTKAGTACRYLDNGDGTVSDLNTGLLWEKKDNLDGVANASDLHDADNVYDLTEDANSAVFFLVALDSGASTDGGASTPITGCFAGHCDWRLPSIVELQGIVDATQGECGGGSGPCIDPAFGPTQAGFYWSATTDVSNPTFAWVVDFGGGGVSEGNKTSGDGVRAVRGGL